MKKPAAVLTALALMASGCAVSHQQPPSALPTLEGVKFPAPAPSESACHFPPVKRDLWKQKEELRRKLKKRQLKVGISWATPRLSFWNPYTGEFGGFEIELVTEIAKEIFGPNARKRNKVVFVVVPFAKNVDLLNKGTVNILAKSMTITCLRAEDVAFSRSYLDTGQTMLVRGDSKYKSVNDLQGRRVCSGEGTVSIENVRKLPGKMVPVTVPVTSDCMLMLRQRQVEAISSDESILRGLEDMDGSTKLLNDPPREENKECRRNKHLNCTWFSSGSYGFAFRKDDEDLLSFVNIVLNEMRSDGRWKEIHDKWLRKHPDKGLLPDPPSGGRD